MARFPKLSLYELEPGGSLYMLTSDDFEPYSDTFQLCGKEGGGYDWQSVAEYLLRSESRKLADAISFDSEAGMFCAVSDRQAALKKLADLIRQTFRSKRRLEVAVRKSNAEQHPERHKREKRRSEPHDVLVIHFNVYLYEKSERLKALLNSNLTSEHVLVSNPSACGETTFYIRTNDTNAAMNEIKPLLKDLNLLKTAILACAPGGSAEYSVLWPRNRKKKLVPKNEL